MKNINKEKAEVNYKTLSIVLAILLLISAGFIAYLMILKGSNVADLTDYKEQNPVKANTITQPVVVEESNDIVSNNFPVVKINKLSEKLSKLNFDNKTEATNDDGDGVADIVAHINNGGVVVNILNGENTSYVVDGINNAVSLGVGLSVQGNGTLVTYILTGNGKVFKIEDDLNNVKENYKGTAIDLEVTDATAIAVVDNNFNLDDEAQTTLPTVYIKTKDGRVLTDETSLTSTSKIVEVVENN